MVTLLQIGQLVQVQSRTWAGINQRGGVGKILKVNQVEQEPVEVDYKKEILSDGVKYDVAYMLGGKESMVDAFFVSPHSFEDDHSSRRRRAAPVDTNTAALKDSSNNKKVAKKQKKAASSGTVVQKEEKKQKKAKLPLPVAKECDSNDDEALKMHKTAVVLKEELRKKVEADERARRQVQEEEAKNKLQNHPKFEQFQKGFTSVFSNKEEMEFQALLDHFQKDGAFNQEEVSMFLGELEHLNVCFWCRDSNMLYSV